MSVLLISEMQETNGALFLKANFLSYALLSGFVTVIAPLTTMYASLKSHKSDLKIDVLNLLCLLVCIYLQSYLADHELLFNF